MELTEQEMSILRLANNEEGFTTDWEIRSVWNDNCDEAIVNLLTNGLLMTYDACYWITYDGVDHVTI